MKSAPIKTLEHAERKKDYPTSLRTGLGFDFLFRRGS